ncbi:MAG: aminopeptidase P N-terminal domain-containing protein [Myxococcales bacterium]|nr:aminopeptidase P N-terminal domain-containing protein [Myxococcales bacterium]
MTATPDFAAHRARLLDALDDDEAVLVFGGPVHLRNGDSEYRYRPDSDVYWLTGWEDPEVAVFVRPGKEPLVMFVQPKDPAKEIWTGRRPGPEGAKADFGADVAYPMAEIQEHLPRLLQGVRALHYAFAKDPDADALVMSSVAKAAKAARKNGLTAPETFHHPSKVLHELRLHKQADELELMRHAARLTAEGHARAMALAASGVSEYEVEAALLEPWRRSGSTGSAYTPIVAGGANGTVLHYVTNRDVLRAGDLLLIDAGCEVSYYACDVTRTFPVDGRFTDAQRQVYEIVLRAEEEAIAVCRAGQPHKAIHDTAVRVLTEGMVALGLLEGPVDDRIEDESFKRYYMHGTSHWLGLDVHDVGAYGRDGASTPLAPGMVLTVEPGLYVAEDDEEAPEHLRGIAVRIEDDVLVTEGDPVVLTAAIPKHPEQVEAACRAATT